MAIRCMLALSMTMLICVFVWRQARRAPGGPLNGRARR
jgi:hypothetical protein